MPFFLLLLLGGGAVAAAAVAKRRWEYSFDDEGATITVVRPGPVQSRVAPYTVTPRAAPVAAPVALTPKPLPPVPTDTGVVMEGRFTGRYGVRRSAKHIHKGIDISAKKGTPVTAINDGTIFALYPDGQRYGYGNSLLMKHPDGKFSFYAHLNGFAKRQGEHARKGETIGYVGATQKRIRGGRVMPNPRPHMPPHLHMEVHTDMHLRNGNPVIAENLPNRMDPLLYMKQVGSKPVGVVV
jgi:murein DD-endopeptidase MepM/ murein hydrolase activator NlpD